MKKAALLFLIFFNIFIYAKINVAVSIAPEEFILKKIAKDLVNINTIVKPGNSPHTYEPKPSQMKDLSSAKIYFAIGVEFENSWLKKFQDLNPKMKIVYVDKSITKYPINKKEKGKHLDPHIWLNPINLKTIAKNMTDALKSIDKNNSKKYEAGLRAFEKEMDKLDSYIKDKLSNLKNRNFLVFHPSWGYYAKRYNLNQIAIELGGKAPKPKELIKIIEFSKNNNIKVIIAQPEFSEKSAKIIANEINGKVLKVSPVNEKVVENIKKITDIIAKYNGGKN